MNDRSTDRFEAAKTLVEKLRDPRLYDHPVARIEVVETHLSWLLLTGSYAYKLKKPIALAFVDFSTLERRRRACEDELELNRRMAPTLYLSVVPIGGSPDAPRLECEPAIEYAVKMHQFPADARLDLRIAARAPEERQFTAFAARMAAFHAALPPESAATAGDVFDPASRFRANLGELANELPRTERNRLLPFEQWFESREAWLERTFHDRLAGGFVREGHGDLHLENLVVLDGEIVAFDALEFSRALRCNDVIDEVAFPVMDLLAHGRGDLGFVFLSRYLQITGDYGALPALPFYLVYRALVRAKVRAIRRKQTHSERRGTEIDYIATASDLTAPRSPRLLITRGLSGSGKTRLAERLIGKLRALSVRSDLERKRLFGLEERAESGADIGAGIYAPTATDRTYDILASCAEDGLQSGFDMIVDATFLARARRDRFRDLADLRGARLCILECTAPADTLRERVVERQKAGADASEATLDVLERQLETAEPLEADELRTSVRIDTAKPIDLDALAEQIEAIAPA